jgi:hypothetical protein
MLTADDGQVTGHSSQVKFLRGRFAGFWCPTEAIKGESFEANIRWIP